MMSILLSAIITVLLGIKVNAFYSICVVENNYILYIIIRRILVKYVEYFRKYFIMDNFIPGLSVAIVKDNKIVYKKGYGAADNSGRKITPQTPFDIGSISKSFCALTIRQLINENKIDLDTPIQKYIPWFHLYDEDASKKITVRNLLDHKSGISTAAGNQYYIFSDKYTRKQLIESFSKLKITNPVGTTYQYSNINYIILGQVVEEASGMPYESYIQKNIYMSLNYCTVFYRCKTIKIYKHIDNSLCESYNIHIESCLYVCNKCDYK